MGDQWGIGGFRGGGVALYQANRQKKSLKKSEKAPKSEKIGGKNRKNVIFFLLNMV